MSWSNIEEKHRKKFNRHFVVCDESNEMVFIKECVNEEFPWLTDDAVNNAILSCCASLPTPRLRSSFLSCLKKKLGGV